MYTYSITAYLCTHNNVHTIIPGTFWIKVFGPSHINERIYRMAARDTSMYIVQSKWSSTYKTTPALARRKPKSGLYNHWFSTYKAIITPALARRKPKSGLYNHWFSTYKAKTTPALARWKPKSGLYNHWLSTYKAKTTPAVARRMPKSGLCSQWSSTYKTTPALARRKLKSGLYNHWFSTYKAIITPALARRKHAGSQTAGCTIIGSVHTKPKLLQL